MSNEQIISDLREGAEDLNVRLANIAKNMTDLVEEMKRLRASDIRSIQE